MCLLPLLASLSDASHFDPAFEYEKAKLTFVHGRLDAAQDEASRGYQRSLVTAPDWSHRFQLLEATAMVWRGSDEDLLQLLATPSPAAFKVDEEIEQDALETTALIHLGRLSEAGQILDRAERSCTPTLFLECGMIVRARALLYFNRGEFEPARKSYLSALDFSRTHHDKLLEGTVLLNLASTLSQLEHHDEALDMYKASYRAAMEIGAEDLAQSALSGEGWESYNLGNSEKALDLYASVEKRAASLGDKDSEAQSLTVEALVYASLGQLKLAETSDLRAIKLAKQLDRKDKIVNASEDLAQVYIDEGMPDEADRYAVAAEKLAQASGNRLDILECHRLQGQAAVLRHDWPRATALLQEVALAPESLNRMKRNAQHTLGTMYESLGQMSFADESYKAALALVEAARADLKQEASQLSFLTNATQIYDDYIHFLVTQGRTDEALEAADWSRARTLQQGLGVISASANVKPPPFRAADIATKTNSTLLFYWLGDKQSYVWAISPDKSLFVSLPAKSEVVALLARYRQKVLALRDTVRENDKDGHALYEVLVAPISSVVSRDRPVILFTDGEMSQLNFETVVVAEPKPHYWIEDATVSSAPSIRLFALRNTSVSPVRDRILLFGDSISVDPAFPDLPMAGLEIQKVKDNFQASDEVVFSSVRATPRNYLASRPEQFSYIHFVAHGTANRTDPLESAVILSPDRPGDDSYKLYARDILQHPITARLVTISACNSSGTKAYAGEGLVGLSWAFLRAGAHNTIGALWDVSDASTPQLMDHLYGNLEKDQSPAVALRNAKLALLHSGGTFSRPFYWAPFQLYSGR